MPTPIINSQIDSINSTLDGLNDDLGALNTALGALPRKVTALRDVIDVDEVVINNSHNYFDYKYSDYATVTEAGLTATQVGNTITLHRPTAQSYNHYIRLSNGLAIANNNSQVNAWNTGIYFEEGHQYLCTLKLLSGSSTVGGETKLPYLFVYKTGYSTSIGGFNFVGDEAIRGIYATADLYNLVIYTTTDYIFDNAKFLVVVEDVTVKNITDTGLYNNLISERPATYEFTNGGFSRAGAVLGDDSKYYLITGDYVQPNLIHAEAKDGYKITLMAFDRETLSYVGFLTSINSITSDASKSVRWLNNLNFVVLNKLYPDYLFRIEVTKDATAGGTKTSIYTNEAESVIFTEYATQEIRDYYKDEMDKTLTEVQNAITSPALVFPVVTDIHFCSLSILTTLFNACAQNMNYLTQRISCDFVLNLGDNTDGNETPSITMGRNKYMLQQFAKMRENYFQAIGNHDTNYYQSATKLTAPETFLSYMSNTKGVVFDSNNMFNFYKDFDELGVRVVVVDANYLKQYEYSSTTASWLTNTALNTNKLVVLCEHLSSIATMNWNAQSLTNGSGVTTALQTFVNNGGKLIQLCGHSHADYYYNSPWFTVYNCCQKAQQVDVTESGYQAITGYVGDMVSWERTRRTYTEDLWSVVVLKPLDGEMDFIRFGAGVNRYFHYNHFALTSSTAFTSQLSGTLTWSTSNGSVATVSNGTATPVASGMCQITATDADGNFETWTVAV